MISKKTAPCTRKPITKIRIRHESHKRARGEGEAINEAPADITEAIEKIITILKRQRASGISKKGQKSVQGNTDFAPDPTLQGHVHMMYIHNTQLAGKRMHRPQCNALLAQSCHDWNLYPTMCRRHVYPR
jgi:hypothetical protein